MPDSYQYESGFFMNIPEKFNIRVYGLWINSNHEILVCDETYNGMQMTKFPGGGLEFGEGPVDCLKREWKEELDLSIKIIRHFYTTDYFQPSVFNSKDQLISIYYLVSGKTKDLNTTQKVRWIPLNNIHQDMVTFPIDKKIIQLLKADL